MLKAKLLGATAGAEAALAIEDVFSTYLYKGNGTGQTINNGIDLAGEGGLVWIKGRSSLSSQNHAFIDTIRGGSKVVFSDVAIGQINQADYISAFNANGFSISTNLAINNSSGNYASWTFRQAPRFFDVVTYTGTGANRTIAHDLGIVPGCIIVKRTDTTGDWQVYHRSLANTEYLVLNSTAAKATGTTRWNSTTPTSSVFSLGTDATVNASGGTYVAYLFAHDPLGPSGDGSDGLIACGSFTATGAEQEIDVGFEPQFVIRKLTNAAAGWAMFDNMRGFSQTNTAYLYPNLSNAESNYTGADNDKPTSRGFKFTGGNGQTYIYIAIRRGPMREPTVGTQVFKALVRTGTASSTTVSGFGFPVDLVASLFRAFPEDVWFDRLRGASRQIATTSTAAEVTQSASINGFDVMDGYKVGIDNVTNMTNGNTSANGYLNYAFRRAPGFFDVVAYTGDGVAGRTVPHNLGVAPEMMIVKRRNATGGWPIFHSGVYALDPDGALQLNSTAPSTSFAGQLYFGTGTGNVVPPTDTVFTVGGDFNTNGSGGTHIAYLFASLPGISKVGSYTGNGSSQTINCGFTTGARFVLIKRTDSAGDWYVWDTARGIVTGNDPRLSLNTTAAEVTTDDTVDPDNSGFIVNQVSATNVSVNAASYIYLAIA